MQVSGNIDKTEQNKIHHKAVITLLQAQNVTSELIMSRENKVSLESYPYLRHDEGMPWLTAEMFVSDVVINYQKLQPQYYFKQKI